MVQTWKVCVDKTTRGSNPLFSARQYSSVIEQKIHTLLVGGLIPSTALCRWPSGQGICLWNRGDEFNSHTTPRPISIVVMQQFSKLQRTVQFCYWALNYLEIPDSSICLGGRVVECGSLQNFLSWVRIPPQTFNPVDFHGINLIPSRQIGKVTSL